MPRNLKDNRYFTVPLKRSHPLYARLTQEAETRGCEVPTLIKILLEKYYEGEDIKQVLSKLSLQPVASTALEPELDNAEQAAAFWGNMEDEETQ